MNAEWKQFEQAVGAFLQALDPSAKVTHDKQTPDADTGTPRQRDVWIETTFGGHLQITILVSCKRKKAKLNQQDLDAFVGELRSSGANKGVLYAYSGFTKPALQKAHAIGISCCVLFEGSAPEIPVVLAFNAYCFRELVSLRVDGVPEGSTYTYAEVLEIEASDHAPERPAVQLLSEEFRKAKPDITAGHGSLPAGRRAEIAGMIEHLGIPLRLILETRWAIYRAKLESWLVNGSYSLTEKDFKGTMMTPAIDTFSAHPGPGWEQIEADEMTTRSFTAVYFGADDSEEALRRWALQETRLVQGKSSPDLSAPQ